MENVVINVVHLNCKMKPQKFRTPAHCYSQVLTRHIHVKETLPSQLELYLSFRTVQPDVMVVQVSVAERTRH